MGKSELLDKVRHALHIADGIHDEHAEAAAALVDAATRCREAQSDLKRLLASYRPQTAEGMSACNQLLRKLDGFDCGEDLLVRVLATYDVPKTMVYGDDSPGNVH